MDTRVVQLKTGNRENGVPGDFTLNSSAVRWRGFGFPESKASAEEATGIPWDNLALASGDCSICRVCRVIRKVPLLGSRLIPDATIYPPRRNQTEHIQEYIVKKKDNLE
jgi:hypothetical protein